MIKATISKTDGRTLSAPELRAFPSDMVWLEQNGSGTNIYETSVEGRTGMIHYSTTALATIVATATGADYLVFTAIAISGTTSGKVVALPVSQATAVKRGSGATVQYNARFGQSKLEYTTAATVSDLYDDVLASASSTDSQSILYADIATISAASEFVPGKNYIVTDRGSFVATGLSATVLSSEGWILDGSEYYASVYDWDNDYEKRRSDHRGNIVVNTTSASTNIDDFIWGNDRISNCQIYGIADFTGTAVTSTAFIRDVVIYGQATITGCTLASSSENISNILVVYGGVLDMSDMITGGILSQFQNIVVGAGCTLSATDNRGAIKNVDLSTAAVLNAVSNRSVLGFNGVRLSDGFIMNANDKATPSQVNTVTCSGKREITIGTSASEVSLIVTQNGSNKVSTINAPTFATVDGITDILDLYAALGPVAQYVGEVRLTGLTGAVACKGIRVSNGGTSYRPSKGSVIRLINATNNATNTVTVTPSGVTAITTDTIPFIAAAATVVLTSSGTVLHDSLCFEVDHTTGLGYQKSVSIVN